MIITDKTVKYVCTYIDRRELYSREYTIIVVIEFYVGKWYRSSAFPPQVMSVYECSVDM